jgi:hypothetical protein
MLATWITAAAMPASRRVGVVRAAQLGQQLRVEVPGQCSAWAREWIPGEGSVGPHGEDYPSWRPIRLSYRTLEIERR